MRISVALCTFNGARYLPDQLASLETQERMPDELVVCDDGSTDDTLQVLEDFATRAPFSVRVICNAETLGPTKNFEKAIRLSEGEIIALCDQDDVWRPGRLARAAEAFGADPQIGITFSDADLLDETGAPLDGRLWDAVRFTPELRRRVERQGLLPTALRKDVVTGATMSFRAELRERICPIPEAWHHDAWTALICAFISDHRMFPEPLIRYRVHTSQEVGVYQGPEDEGRPGPRGAGGLGGLKMAEDGSAWRRVWRALRQRSERRRLYADLSRRNHEVADWFNLAAAQAGAMRPLEKAAAERIIATIEDRAYHYRQRGSTPDGRLRRIPIVWSEWRRGAYRRLSGGVVDALLDLA